jgi:hypothetical protein
VLLADQLVEPLWTIAAGHHLISGLLVPGLACRGLRGRGGGPVGS